MLILLQNIEIKYYLLRNLRWYSNNIKSQRRYVTAYIVLCIIIILLSCYFTITLILQFSNFAYMFVFSILQKNTLCLVVWLFAVTVLIFPEAGMVIYMSVQFWVCFGCILFPNPVSSFIKSND